MYDGSIDHGRIIAAFQRSVPGCYVRDYRSNGGYIVIARDYRDIKWTGPQSTAKVERRIPAVTLVNLPRGNVTAATRYVGLRLDRPGWRREFRRAAQHLSVAQMRRITRELGVDEVFPGIRR